MTDSKSLHSILRALGLRFLWFLSFLSCFSDLFLSSLDGGPTRRNRDRKQGPPYKSYSFMFFEMLWKIHHRSVHRSWESIPRNERDRWCGQIWNMRFYIQLTQESTVNWSHLSDKGVVWKLLEYEIICIWWNLRTHFQVWILIWVSLLWVFSGLTDLFLGLDLYFFQTTIFLRELWENTSLESDSMCTIDLSSGFNLEVQSRDQSSKDLAIRLNPDRSLMNETLIDLAFACIF